MHQNALQKTSNRDYFLFSSKKEPPALQKTSNRVQFISYLTENATQIIRTNPSITIYKNAIAQQLLQQHYFQCHSPQCFSIIQ